MERRLPAATLVNTDLPVGLGGLYTTDVTHAQMPFYLRLYT